MTNQLKMRAGGFLTLLIVVLPLAGCPGPAGEWSNDIHECLNQGQTPLDAQGLVRDTVGKLRQGLYASTEYFWKVREIPVCWESESMGDGDAEERARTQKRIEETWGDALNMPQVPEKDRIRFAKKWEKCGLLSAGIRIRLRDKDDVPGGGVGATFGVGTQIDGLKDGLNLRRDQVEKDYCKNPGKIALYAQYATYEDCVAARMHRQNNAAIHEFGHALGLQHEQKRPDTPASCTLNGDQSVKGDGNLTVGAWDQESVMNYCAFDDIDGLTDWDKIGIQIAYYPAYFDLQCVTRKRDEAMGKEVNSNQDKGDLPEGSSTGTRPAPDAGSAP